FLLTLFNIYHEVPNCVQREDQIESGHLNLGLFKLEKVPHQQQKNVTDGNDGETEAKEDSNDNKDDEEEIPMTDDDEDKTPMRDDDEEKRENTNDI
ncbi:unnamed protein product, partial [Didymodactylos carnosus]